LLVVAQEPLIQIHLALPIIQELKEVTLYLALLLQQAAAVAMLILCQLLQP
jgi:hypothetical protein